MLADRRNPDEEPPEDVSHGLEFGETNPDDAAHIARAWKQPVLKVFRPSEIGR
jgi:hypothetical protein